MASMPNSPCGQAVSTIYVAPSKVAATDFPTSTTLPAGKAALNRSPHVMATISNRTSPASTGGVRLPISPLPSYSSHSKLNAPQEGEPNFHFPGPWSAAVIPGFIL